MHQDFSKMTSRTMIINIILYRKCILGRSLVLLALVMVSSVKSLPLRVGSAAEKHHQQGDYTYHSDHNLILNTTICKDRCMSGCINYLTPIGSCYNGNSFLIGRKEKENSNPFGENDIWDDPVLLLDGGAKRVIAIQRKFYNSTNSSCTGGITDFFDKLPLEKCIGPFGPPRPWGILALASEELFQTSSGQISLY